MTESPPFGLSVLIFNLIHPAGLLTLMSS